MNDDKIFITLTQEQALATCAVLQQEIDRMRNMDLFDKDQKDTTVIEKALKAVMSGFTYIPVHGDREL